MEITTNGNFETQKLGALIGKHIFKGMIIALKGDVGAGKTEFVKGFTAGANSDIATSPTFAIMNVYYGSEIPIYHFDFYRCNGDYDEFEEYIFGEGAALIEWSEYLDLPSDILTVNILKLNEDSRKIEFTAGSDVYEKLLKEAYSEYISY